MCNVTAPRYDGLTHVTFRFRGSKNILKLMVKSGIARIPASADPLRDKVVSIFIYIFRT